MGVAQFTNGCPGGALVDMAAQQRGSEEGGEGEGEKRGGPDGVLI